MLLARSHFRGKFALNVAAGFDSGLNGSVLNIVQFGLGASFIATLSYSTSDRIFPAPTDEGSGESRTCGYVADSGGGVLITFPSPITLYGTQTIGAAAVANWTDTGSPLGIQINVENSGLTTQFMQIDWSVAIVHANEFVDAAPSGT